jgi:hypothetical protein
MITREMVKGGQRLKRAATTSPQRKVLRDARDSAVRICTLESDAGLFMGVGTKNDIKSHETTGHLSPVIAWGGPVRR